MTRGGFKGLTSKWFCSTNIVEMKFPVDPPSNIIDAFTFLLTFAVIFINSDGVAVVCTELMYIGIDGDWVVQDSEEAPSLSTESARFPTACQYVVAQLC